MSSKITYMGFAPSPIFLTYPRVLLSMVAEFRWLPPSISRQSIPHRTPTPPVLGMVPSRRFTLFCARMKVNFFVDMFSKKGGLKTTYLMVYIKLIKPSEIYHYN